jgi:hypothetical protein
MATECISLVECSTGVHMVFKARNRVMFNEQ